MGKAKPRKDNHLVAGILFLILFLLFAGWLLIPILGPEIENAQHMRALQDRGVLADGCVIDKDAHEGFRTGPELTYSFLTSEGLYQGRLRVTEQDFEQTYVGSCFNILYLPEDPTINDAQSRVQAYNLNPHSWERLWFVPLVPAGLVLMILAAIITYYRRRKLKGKNG
ncbi:MAG: hypothetical protein IT320_07785 [Anaerolineae bacterium]|nr:hypothetical protein [Anaerolineae bacterium]